MDDISFYTNLYYTDTFYTILTTLKFKNYWESNLADVERRR